VSADLRAGGETAARRRAEADRELARAAFDELLADAVNARLHASPAYDTLEDRLLRLFAEASGDPAARALLSKLARVARGENPFDPAGGPAERAVAAYCAIEQVANPDTPNGAAEQRRRAEAALQAARDADMLIATYYSLGTLGLYAYQGGDLGAARRYWSEARDAARRTGHTYARLVYHRSLALTYARENKIEEALRETLEAEALIASGEIPTAELKDIGPFVYDELVTYYTRLGNRARAAEAAAKAAQILAATAAAPERRAQALERVGQLYAQAAAGSEDDARRGAEALMAAAEIWLKGGQRDRALIDLAGAGVLLVENADGRAARTPFERARQLAELLGDEPSVTGMVYWLARTYLAESRGADPAAARAAHERGLALLAEARARTDKLEREGGRSADVAALRPAIAFWAGRAHLEGPARDAKRAAPEFRRAFDAALAAGDVNNAVLYAEWTLRAYLAASDEAAAARAAGELFDALAGTGRLSPRRAADALAAVYAEVAPEGAHALPAGLVALYDRAAAVPPPRGGPNAALSATTALALAAARARDREVLAARAAKTFDELAAAGRTAEAQDLAEAAGTAWAELGDREEAAGWHARLRSLAEAGYKAARDANRHEDAARAAERLAQAARAAGDDAAAATWARAASDARRGLVEQYERDGRLGQAAEAARELGSGLVASGDHAEARRWFDRAASISSRVGDREGQAESLARRARAEAAVGDARAALATSQEALMLASGRPAGADGKPDANLPRAADVLLPAQAVAALRARAEAYERLGADGAVPAARAADEAVASYALAVELLETAPRVTQTAGDEPLVTPSGDAGLYEPLVRALVSLGRTAEAFSYAARAVAYTLAEQSGPLIAAIPDANVRQLAARALEARRAQFVAAAELRDEAARDDATRNPGRAEAASRRSGEAARAFASGVGEVRARDARYVWLLGSRPPDAAAFQRELAPGAALALYFATADQLYIFVLERDALTVRQAPVGRRALAGMLARPGDGRAGEELYNLLLAPAAGDLAGASAVTVVSAEPLGHALKPLARRAPLQGARVIYITPDELASR
jgi:hypothetical protein